jgi:segregation and condensation protein B
MNTWLSKWNDDDEEFDMPEPDETDDFGETHVLPDEDDDLDADHDYDEDEDEDGEDEDHGDEDDED